LRLDADTKSGKMLSYRAKLGDKTEVYFCNVPGGDKPSAALIAAAAKDPVPDTPAGMLRNCSVEAWVDMTGWRVMASDHYESKRFSSAVVVAVSPSGRKAVACNLMPVPPQETERVNTANNRFFTLDALEKDNPYLLPVEGSARADLFSAGGSKSTYTGWGRVASNATEVRLQLGSRPGYAVPVNDGWFAIAWAKPTEAGGDFGALKAYDKDGKLVRVISES
jgi:hypothetical protein